MAIIPKNRLDGEDVRTLTERLLREHLSFEVEGYKVTTSMVLNVLLKAAIEQRSIDAVCADLVGVVDGNTLREALNRTLTVEQLRQHEVEFNAALAACIPAPMPRQGLEMALDFHDEPFYGHTEALRAYTVRGEARAGTTYFWRIATLYVLWRGVRVTLALTYVLPQESRLSILQRLLQRRTELGFRPKVLYLDKGFCQGEIITYLQEADLPAVIACSIRGPYAGVAKPIAPATPSPMAPARTWRWSPPSNATEKLANRSGPGWSTFWSIWTGQPGKHNSGIVVVSVSNPPIVNCGRCEPTPTRATRRCASSIWRWPCCWWISGSFCVASAAVSSPRDPFVWT